MPSSALGDSLAAAVDVAPVLTYPNGAPAGSAFPAETYVVGPGGWLLPGLTVSDPDSPALSSATVAITGGFQGGEDWLYFAGGAATGMTAPTGDIAGAYNFATGVLTLTSAAGATAAQWAAALGQVGYNEGLPAAHVTDRTITFTINDGTLASAPLTVQVHPIGSPGADTLIGGAGDTVQGGAGNDVLVSPTGSNLLDGGSGFDAGSFVGAPAGVHVDLSLQGPQPVDVSGRTVTLVSIERLYGSTHADTLTGDAGANGFIGEGGNDAIDGGAGNDWVGYYGLNGVHVSLATTDWQDIGGGVMQKLANIECLIGSSFNDTLTGGAGDDYLGGGSGADVLDGGGGSNTADYADGYNYGAGLHVSLAISGPQDVGGEYSSFSGPNSDTLINIQNLVGTTYGDTLTGNDQANVISGWGGSDSIDGGAGDDLLRGGLDPNVTDADPGVVGKDTVTGGAGNDTVLGSDGQNFLTGGDGDDLIQGGAGFDRTNGNVGDDTVHGAGGADWVTGGQNDDVLFGDDGNDILNGNLGADTGDGGAGDDIVRGGQGDDLLSGGAGNDWLSGDRGADTLTGGAGADTFHTFAGAGLDRVTDFNAAEGDRVQLDPGQTYTLRQVGADTVVDLGGGDQLVLAGVQQASLPAGAIFIA